METSNLRGNGDWEELAQELSLTIRDNHGYTLSYPNHLFIITHINNNIATGKKKNLLILLKQYLSLKNNDEIDVYSIINSLLFNNSQKYCIAEYEEVNEIIGKFMEIENNSIIIVETILFLIKENKTMNGVEWNKYLNNYSIYKNMPLKWVLHLVKEEW